MVRLARQQADDAIELPVREAELAMERLFRDRAQEVSLPPAPVVTDRAPAGSGGHRARGSEAGRCPGWQLPAREGPDSL